MKLTAFSLWSLVDGLRLRALSSVRDDCVRQTRLPQNLVLPRTSTKVQRFLFTAFSVFSWGECVKGASGLLILQCTASRCELSGEM